MNNRKIGDKIVMVILKQEAVNWFIVGEFLGLQEEYPNLKIEYSTTAQSDLPFKEQQGYFNIPNELLKELKDELPNIIRPLSDSCTALANLYILLLRTTYNDGSIDLTADYVYCLNEQEKHQVYLALVNSLNEHYYSWSSQSKQVPATVEDWLRLFASSSYRSAFSDPVPYVLSLLPRYTVPRSIHLLDVIPMNPLVRSYVVSWLGMNIICDSNELNDMVQGRPNEICFLSATLLDGPSDNSVIPSWLNNQFIKTIVRDSWTTAGCYVFTNSFRRDLEPYSNNIAQRLRDLLHEELLNDLSVKESNKISWVSELIFPESYMALCAWISAKSLNRVCSNEFYRHLGNSFSLVFDKLIGGIPELLYRDNSPDPLKTFLISDNKYNLIFPYLLLTFYHSQHLEKSLKSWLLVLKVHFYGGYQSQRMALKFSEFLLLVLLSVVDFDSIETLFIESVAKCLNIFKETVLVPYVHLSEREDYIWDGVGKRVGLHNMGLHLVNMQLNRIIGDSILERCFSDFMNTMFQVKVARWPYEDVMDKRLV